MTDDAVKPDRISEERAYELASQGVERAGGSRSVYRNPRHPFTLHPSTRYEIEGYLVEVRHGEISSPAIVSVGGYVFEIHEEGIDLLVRPPKPRP
jgi:hypothetical protein